MGENGPLPAFLSPEWIDALATAVAGAPGANPIPMGEVARLTLRHRIEAAPHGDVEFGVELGPEGPVVRPGPVPSADIEVVQDYATAAAISRGTITPATAFASGQVRMGGRVGLLTRHREGLARFADALATLRESTTY